MKYWTAFNRQVRFGRHDYTLMNDNRFIGAGDPVGERSFEELPYASDVVLVLCDATKEDLLKLENAVVLRLNDFTHVAFSPVVFQTGPGVNYRKAAVGYYKNWTEVLREDILPHDKPMIIRDGKEIAHVCGDCEHIMRRSCGGCEPPIYECDVTPFTKEHVFKLPDQGLHVPVKLCTPYIPFERRALDTVLHEPNKEDDATAHASDNAYKGWTGRYLIDIMCPACMFHDKHGCMVDGRPNYCNGAFPSSRIPYLDSLYLQITRILGTPVDWLTYKRTHSDIPRWTKDPSLVISNITRELQFSVSQTSPTRLTGSHRLFPRRIPALSPSTKLLNEKVDWNAVSWWERFCACMYHAGAFSSEPRCGWGAGGGPLINYAFTNEVLHLSYKRSGWVSGYSFKSFNELATSVFKRQIWYMVMRRYRWGVMDAVHNAVSSRRDCPGNLAAVKKFMALVMKGNETGSSVQLPKVEQLKELLDKHN